MTLELGETKDLTLLAYPPHIGHVFDHVVCHVEDNPEPVMFKVACLGAAPAVAVLLPGEDPPSKEAAQKVVKQQPETPPPPAKGGAKGGKGGKGAKGAKAGKAEPTEDLSLPRVSTWAWLWMVDSVVPVFQSFPSLSNPI